MKTVTISKTEYEDLIEKKLRYEYLRRIIEGDIFSPPTVKKAGEIIGAFKKTGLYNEQFLESLEKGLKRSTYFE